uniref:Putative secreted protein n=1 Tax=Anopheles darlingi TaxID=43151 RepID=A0A2M4DCW6_ANODA
MLGFVFGWVAWQGGWSEGESVMCMFACVRAYMVRRLPSVQGCDSGTRCARKNVFSLFDAFKFRARSHSTGNVLFSVYSSRSAPFLPAHCTKPTTGTKIEDLLPLLLRRET